MPRLPTTSCFCARHSDRGPGRIAGLLCVWSGMWAPKGTPETVVSKLNSAVVDALAKGRSASTDGFGPGGSRSRSAIRGAQRRWPIVREMNLQAKQLAGMRAFARRACADSHAWRRGEACRAPCIRCWAGPWLWLPCRKRARLSDGRGARAISRCYSVSCTTMTFPAAQ